MNLAAFDWGRRAAADRDAVERRAGGRRREGLADLDREAEEARRNLAPGWLSLRRSRDRVLVRHLDGAQASNSR